MADRPGAGRVRRGERRGVGQLAHPPALGQRHAERAEELDDLRVDRRRAGRRDPALVKPDPGEDGLLDRVGQGADRLGVHGGQRAAQRGVQLLPYPGDADQRGRPGLRGDLEEPELVGAVGQRDRVRQRPPVVHGAPGDVRHREVGDQRGHAVRARLVCERDHPQRRRLAVADVPVGDHHGLGAAGGARGVDERRQGVRRHLPPAALEGGGVELRLGVAEVEQRLPAERLGLGRLVLARLGLPCLDSSAVACHIMLGVLAEHDERAQLRQPVLDRGEHGKELALDDHHGRRAVADDVGGLLGGDRGVDEHRDTAGVHHRVVGDRRLRPVTRPDGRELARPQPGRGEAERRVAHLVVQLPVGQRPPLTVGLPSVRHDIGYLRRRLGEGGEQR